MTAAKRAQINFEVVPIPEIEPLKNLRAMMFPMIWIEESISLNKTFTFLFLMLYMYVANIFFITILPIIL